MTFQRGTQWGLDSDPAEGWREYAACQGTDGELFYPSEERGNAHDAKRICSRCPVRLECLEYALERREKFGVWGGTVTKEREQIARCRAGRCLHPEHDSSDDYSVMVQRIAVLAGQGMADYEIGKTVGRSGSRVYELRKTHGIPSGWRSRGRVQ